MALVCLLGIQLPGRAVGQTNTAAITVDLVSTPPHLRPDTDLAQVTLHVRRHGQPLQSGQIQVKVTAPPRPALFSTDFPMVEGTDLLWLTSELQDGTFTFAYLFPIRGTYTFALTITPVPGGPDFAPTSRRLTLQLRENPAEVRNAWLLGLILFALGGLAGVVMARSAAAREALWPTPTLVFLLSLTAACVPGYAATRPESPDVQEAAGWRLEVRPPATHTRVGQLVPFTIVLSKNGQVLPSATRLSLEVRHVEDDKVVFQATTYEPDGESVQRLQFFDGAPHTVTVTAQARDAEGALVTPLPVVVPMQVQGVHPPVAVQIRTLALLLGVLILGMMVGFFVPRWGTG
jgi:hypothetical protein